MRQVEITRIDITQISSMRLTNTLPIIIFLTILFKQLLWSGFIPVFQTPDEQAHFAQVQNIAEGRGAASFSGFSTSNEIYQTEILLHTVRDKQGNNSYTFHPEFNIEYSGLTQGLYESEIVNFPHAYRSEMVITESTFYPPLYYTLASVFYRFVYPTDIITRMMVTRLLSLCIFMAICYFTYLIGKIIFPQNRILQIGLIIFIGFQPMYSFVGAGITSDNLFNLIFVIGIYLCSKYLEDAQGVYFAYAFFYVLLAGLLTKPQGYLLLFMLPGVYVLHTISQGKRLSGKLVRLVLVLVGVLLIPALAVLQGKSMVQEIPALNQLSSLSIPTFIAYAKTTLIHTYREVLPWYWGVFRWLSLSYPRWLHRIINITSGLAIIGIGLYIWDYYKKKDLVIAPKFFMFLLYISCMYFAALFMFDYLFHATYNFSFGIQGRYYFPVIIAHMSLLLVGLVTLGLRFIKINLLMQILISGMVLFHTYAFLFVNASYFGNILHADYFVKASQYKPIFFKSPILEVLMVMSTILTVFMVQKILRLSSNNHVKN